MNNLDKLNQQLKQIQQEYKQNKKNFNTEASLNNNNNNNNNQPLKQLIEKNIKESNAHNDRLNSFFTDSSVCVNKNNKDYYQNGNVKTTGGENTRQHYYQESNNLLNKGGFNSASMTDDSRNYEGNVNHSINQRRFDNPSNQQQFNRISPFIDNKNDKQYNSDISNQRLGEYTPMGRSVAIPVDIEYQINESFMNSRRSSDKKYNSDITNERLSQLSPLAKSSAIPISNKQSNLPTHLNCENTFNQTALNTNYRQKSTTSKFNKNQFDDVNTHCVNAYVNNLPKGTRMN